MKKWLKHCENVAEKVKNFMTGCDMGIRHQRLYMYPFLVPLQTMLRPFSTELLNRFSQLYALVYYQLYFSHKIMHMRYSEDGDMNKLQWPLILKGKGAVQYFLHYAGGFLCCSKQQKVCWTPYVKKTSETSLWMQVQCCKEALQSSSLVKICILSIKGPLI